MEARVLMIGPGEGIGGGIHSLVETFLPHIQSRVPIYYLHSVKHRKLKDSGKLSIRNILIAFSQYIRFLTVIPQFHPTIIHIHTSQGLAWLKDTFYIVIGKIIKCRIVLHIHGGNFDEIFVQYSRLLQLYMRWILSLVDSIIAVSLEWKTRLSPLIPKDRIVVLRNCVDLHTIKMNPSHPSGETVNILFLGRIGQQKGVYDLADAIRQLKSNDLKFHVWMVGPEEQDDDYIKVNACLEKYQVKHVCELVRMVSRERAYQFYRDADIFVLPSYYEGLPMVILEALAAGLPIVATPVGGIPEVVIDGHNGYLVPIADIHALASRLNTLIKDSHIRRIMGMHSRQIAEQELDTDSYVGKLESLYFQMVCR